MVLRAGLRKFISNSTKVLESIPEIDRELKLPLEINLEDTIKTLGIHYHPRTDTFQFKVKLQISDEWPTKRNLLSETSKLFDPLGWLAPVIIRAKIMFQRLWQEGLRWDQKLPKDITKAWIEFRSELHLLENIRINRWIGKGILTSVFELHGFSDASELAYAAVIYARIVDHDGTIRVMMLTSKTRVAPIKCVSLPRLELCGLVLLANLMETVQRAMNVSNENVQAWTDSTIVLGWLRTNPARLKTYVANRVVEVLNLLNVNQCHHIDGTKNPADCASRGINPSELEGHSLWWNGPDCLREHHTSWDQGLEIPQTTLELKTKCVSSFVITASSGLDELINKYSSFKRLVKITAICLKFLENSQRNRETRITSLCLTFINKVRAKKQGSQLFITAQDLQKAELRIIRLCQSRDFNQEIHHLANKKPINKKSKLITLNPFLDSDGCMRVGGRLEEANIPYERKHPLILAPGTITKLIISDAHKKALHGGLKLTMNLIRETYWIINLRRYAKKCILDCIKCCRFKKENSEQIMADLPKARVNMSPVFSQTGLDYAGPIKIKASNIRSTPIRIPPIIVNGEVIKSIPKVPVYEGYIAVFVCLATKAMHLEAVSDMTTETFLAAFERFTARRGSPECCHSDNGTTFVGAKNVLAAEAEMSLLDYDQVSSHTIENGTNWKFITPRAPNQGGIWEAGVKSMKHHLKRVIGETVLTYEELSTILARIEACLNSRPLCPLNDDPDDLSVLTPGHFLIGRPLIARPQVSSNSKSMGLQERWRIVQKIQNDFWNSWSQEYLNELQVRQKWLLQRRNFMEGDMVLLKEDNVPPAKWPVARIVKTLPSPDGNVRSVIIKTTNSSGKLTELERPILKLRLLLQDGSDAPSANIDGQTN